MLRPSENEANGIELENLLWKMHREITLIFE